MGSELQKEAHLVKQIMHELDFFSCAHSFGPQISDEPSDLFSKQNKSQKSIQDRYEARNPKKKSMRKQHKSSRNRMRKNILSPIQKQKKQKRDRKERCHVNPKRS